MDNIIDMLATNAPSHEISDAIKSSLYSKSLDKIAQFTPYVANSMFDVDADDADDLIITDIEPDEYQEEEY